MLRRLSRISILFVALLTSDAWSLGLGEIRLQSALNEPLRARIELLSATPEELTNLKISMASSETFERYGIDRPVFLQGIQFQVVRGGNVSSNYIEARSGAPITEPFLTFLVEANWARGRLLREYTVLLDPPTFAPPASVPAPAVRAPARAAPADSGRIEPAAAAPQRAAPATQPAAPAAAPAARATQPTARPAPVDDSAYDTAAGGDYYVQRGDTLWGVAQRVRPDGRLTMNQMMLAIFEANRDAFGGNINLLQAGRSLRIPSADEIFRITRGEALSEVQRQNEAWSSGTVVPLAEDTTSRPNLTLVPPDEDYTDAGSAADSVSGGEQPVPTRAEAIERRIDELMAEVPQQRSLIEIRDNELAALREELAQIRGEPYEPVIDEPVVDTVDEGLADDEVFVDDSEIMADDAAVEDGVPSPGEVGDGAADDEVAAEETPPPVVRTRRSEPSLIDQALGILTNFWTIVIAALVVVGGVLFWFMRRGRGDGGDEPEAWRGLDDDDDEAYSATETLRAPRPKDESIVVVEQQSSMGRADATIDAPRPAFDFDDETAIDGEPSGEFGSLEDTFSSEAALNLDQSDPIAEADFHMAYGLYDQAADLVNGALAVEPERQDLLSKLCEIYFVWGNRDAFVDAASRLKHAIGGGSSSDWDKIVIMGQQIAADNALFAGAAVAGATRAVDLSFDSGGGDTGALDMELFAESGSDSDVIDLGSAAHGAAADNDVDFDLDVTAEAPAAEEADFDLTEAMSSVEKTLEMPPPEPTVESPTLEQPFDDLGGTAELPSISDPFDLGKSGIDLTADQTAEINLDELGLDLDGLDETELGSFDDFDDVDDMSATEALSGSGFHEAFRDESAVTGKNPEVDPNSTGVRKALSADDTGINEAIENATDTSINESLLDATGVTQVLSRDLAVDTTSDARQALGDDDATMLAPGYGDHDATLRDDQETLLASLDDDDDYDFAKTEALPADVFAGDASLDETGEMPALASTNVDLDLDDLTAALQVSDVGDTIERMRDDATVEQPRPGMYRDEDAATMALGPDDMSDDLNDARTMTEVGTKLDLARAYVDMGDPAGARSILEEVLDEGDEAQRQQARQLLDSLPS